MRFLALVVLVSLIFSTAFSPAFAQKEAQKEVYLFCMVAVDGDVILKDEVPVTTSSDGPVAQLDASSDRYAVNAKFVGSSSEFEFNGKKFINEQSIEITLEDKKSKLKTAMVGNPNLRYESGKPVYLSTIMTQVSLSDKVTAACRLNIGRMLAE